MNRDDIIRMAREQGLPETEVEGVFTVNSDDLGRLLAAERERLKWDGIHSCGNDCQRPACVQAREQRARIYEECAKAVEVFDKTFQTGGVIAHAIRARIK